MTYTLIYGFSLDVLTQLASGVVHLAQAQADVIFSTFVLIGTFLVGLGVQCDHATRAGRTEIGPGFFVPNRQPTLNVVSEYQFRVLAHFGAVHGVQIAWANKPISPRQARHQRWYSSSTTHRIGQLKLNAIKDIYFPPNLESTPAPDATQFTILETQDFLGSREREGLMISKWSNIHFPAITDRDFETQLSNAIKSLPEGQAFAVLFTAEGEARYATLGPSFIVTRDANIQEVLEHLRANHHFVCDNSRGTFNDRIICRWRPLGKTSRVVPLIMKSKVPTVRAQSPSGIVRQTLALPIPLFNFNDILAQYRLDRSHALAEYRRICDIYDEAAALLARTRKGRGHAADISIEGLRTAVKRAESRVEAAQEALDNAGLGPLQAYQGWTLVSASRFTINLTGPDGGTIQVTKTPDGWKGVYTDGRIALPFSDSIMPAYNGEPAAIRRELPAGAIFFKGGKIIKFEEKFSSKRLIHTAKVNANNQLDITRIITADIEALIVNNRTHLPWVAEWYGVNKDGSTRGGVFKFTEYNRDPTDMLKAFWADILKHCRGCTVYFHNWAGYDAFHSLNALVLIAEDLGLTIQPMLHNGKVISLKVFELNRTILEVKDSILLCPGSLGSLAKSFKVDCLKGHSPHYFNPMEHGFPNLDYVGQVPAYEYFESKRTSIAEWEAIVAQYPEGNWNWLENELKYLHSDCVALHQVLVKFFSGFQQEFALNPLANCTIPGLAFKTWRAHHMPAQNLQIEDLSQSYDPLFREGYFGGIVDVYRPRVTNGFYYDVNSLYPSAMTRPMPIGLPVLVTISVDEFLHSDFFGFVKATVKAPDTINIGLLPLRHEGKLICPAGQFNGLFFSEELRMALANGYTLVSIEFAYRFERHDNVFNDLIVRLNDMKAKAQINGQPALRSLAKMLMNSLYGRFGMHPHNTRTIMASPEQSDLISAAFPITRTIPFTNGTELIEFNPLPNWHAVESGLASQSDVTALMNQGSAFSQTNVPLAAAITAYSRMIINTFKLYCLNNQIGVYYSDTDSLVTDAVLPAEFISDTTLGLLKLEHQIIDGFFIAPKLYWLECSDTDGNTYIVSRSRGYGGQLTRQDAEALYNGSHITVNKQKWARSWQEHSIFTDFDLKLNITGEFSKRDKVLDLDGNWVDTRPIVMNETALEPLNPSPLPNGLTSNGVITILHKLQNDYLKRANVRKYSRNKIKAKA